MAVTTNQIGNLATAMSTGTGLPKAVCQKIIEECLASPAFVFPVNVSGFPLQVEGITAALIQPSSAQTIVTLASQTEGGVTCTANTGLALRTVTANKTFYVTDILVYGTQTTPFDWFIKDSLTVNTGSIVAQGRIIATGDIQSYVQNFRTPLPFTTGLFIDVTSSQNNLIYVINGFEA